MNSAIPVIGINIGGGYCNVAVSHHGKIEVVANDRGNRCTPCCVAFAGDEIITGEAAKAQQHKNLANTLQYMMKFMGLNFDELAANNVDLSSYPFKIVKGSEDGSNAQVVLPFPPLSKLSNLKKGFSSFLRVCVIINTVVVTRINLTYFLNLLMNDLQPKCWHAPQAELPASISTLVSPSVC
jgi:hypothetical protein